MRRCSLLVALLAVLALASGAEAKTLFVVKGKGWGHGVGMSQWGAQGKALNGAGYGAILNFYYDPASVGDGAKSRVRVLLVSNRSAVTLSSDASFTVGSKTLDADTAYRVVPTADGTKVRIVGVGKFANGAIASPGADFLRLNGDRYRGSFKLWVRSDRIAVVNVVSMQGYLYSVVPREMPSSFELEALKAQAVAARSYATRAARASWFDLYADTRDQVYGGYESGEPARAVSAVQGTAGKVVLYEGTVAQAFFSSSNGGYQAASVDTWGGNVPYLGAKPDPDDLTPANPNRSWQVLFRPSKLGDRLGTPPPTDAAITERASGRVKSLKVSGADWARTITDKAEYFRSALALKSSRIWVGVQAIRASRSSIQCGNAVRLYIFAHGVGSVSAQQRPAGSSTWTSIRLNKIDATHWRTTRHPCTSMDYRVVSARATGPKIHVSVSPSVAFAVAQQADGLDGRISPAVAGSVVTVERRGAHGWEPVAYATVGEDGTFDTEFPVSEGVYRAIVAAPAPGGFLPGYTRKLTVVFR